MRSVGVNVAAGAAYISVVDEGELVEADPYRLVVPQGLVGARALLGLRDDVAKIISMHSIVRLRVLDAETSSKGTYASLKDRLAVETIFIIAAAEQGIDAGRVSRVSAARPNSP